MKKTLMQILWVMAIALVAIPTYAQSQGQINAQMKANMIRRTQQIVGQLNDYIASIAYKYENMTYEKQIEQKEYYRKQALNLFIFKGEKYTVIMTTKNIYGEETVDTIHKVGAIMEVTSLKNPDKPSRNLVKNYLKGLMKLRYSQVDIKTTDSAKMRVTPPQKIGDNLYKCTCYFEQEFIGKTGEFITYGDKTTKRVDSIIAVLETEDGIELDVKLGDVTAVETKSLHNSSL